MKTLLVLNLPPELEEDMVDYLLSLDGVGGFTSYVTRGHGEGAALSVAEQVSGRRQRLQFELLVDEEAVEGIVSGLVLQVGQGIVYWEHPVRRYGRI